MGLNLTSVSVRCLLGPQGFLGPIADAFWIHSYSKTYLYDCFAFYPTHFTPPHQPPVYQPPVGLIPIIDVYFLIWYIKLPFYTVG